MKWKIGIKNALGLTLLLAYTESGNGNPTGLPPVGSENPPFVVGITPGGFPIPGPSARGISSIPPGLVYYTTTWEWVMMDWIEDIF